MYFVKLGIVLLITLFAFSCTRHQENMLDDFEKGSNNKNWKFVNDGGSLGSFEFTSENTGNVARLKWDVTHGGRWTGAEMKIMAVPASAKGIRLMLKCSGASTAWLFLIDSLDIRYEYRLTRSLTDLNDSIWFSRTVYFATTPDSIRKGHYSQNFQRSLKSIIVAVEPRMDPWYPKIRWFPQPTGTMFFDDLEWVTDYDEPVELIEAADKATPAEDLWARTGVCTHFEEGDLSNPEYIKAAGFNVVRADILWKLIETKKGVYNFSFFDSLVTVAEQHKIRTLFILDYSNPIYTKKDNSAIVSQEHLAAFGRFCAETARHFKGRMIDFEIWNEPNLKYAWDPAPDPAQFARLLRIAVDSVKSVNLNAKVITGGTAGIDWRFVDSLGICNSLKGVDGIGIHPYSKGSPESFSEDLVCLRWLTKKYFDKYPKEWATESGSNSLFYGAGYSDSAKLWQARIDVRAVLANWLAGFEYSVKYEFFTWGNNPEDKECNFGIISPDLVPRPSYTAIKALYKLTAERNWAGRVSTRNHNAYALQFDGEDDRLLILWTSAGRIETDSAGYKTRFLLKEKPLGMYDYLGNEMKIVSEENGRWPVEADGEIKYIKIAKR